MVMWSTRARTSSAGVDASWTSRNSSSFWHPARMTELHGDIEHYYVVEHTGAGTTVRTFATEAGKIGAPLSSVAVPAATFFISRSPRAACESFRVCC